MDEGDVVFGIGYLWYAFMLLAMGLPFVWASRRQWLQRLRWPLTFLVIAWLAVAIVAGRHMLR